jgi:hypothetical protein
MTDPTPEAFAAVAGLVALITDAKACGKRLDELKKLGDEVAKSQAKLDTDRAEHERASTTRTREFDEREAKLRDREVKVIIAERNLLERQQEIAAARPPRFSDDPNMGPGGKSWSGLTREEYRE